MHRSIINIFWSPQWSRWLDKHFSLVVSISSALTMKALGRLCVTLSSSQPTEAHGGNVYFMFRSPEHCTQEPYFFLWTAPLTLPDALRKTLEQTGLSFCDGSTSPLPHITVAVAVKEHIHCIFTPDATWKNSTARLFLPDALIKTVALPI